MLEIVNIVDEKKHSGFDERKSKFPTTNAKLLPLVIQPPKLELKTLPDHLKYSYLGEENNLLVIISNKLSRKEEELISLLKNTRRKLGG